MLEQVGIVGTRSQHHAVVVQMSRFVTDTESLDSTSTHDSSMRSAYCRLLCVIRKFLFLMSIPSDQQSTW